MNQFVAFARTYLLMSPFLSSLRINKIKNEYVIFLYMSQNAAPLYLKMQNGRRNIENANRTMKLNNGARVKTTKLYLMVK